MKKSARPKGPGRSGKPSAVDGEKVVSSAVDGSDFFQALALSSSDAILVVEPDHDCQLVFINPAGARLLGRAGAEPEQRPLASVHASLAAALAEQVSVGETGTSIEFDHRSDGGEFLRLEAVLNAVCHQGRSLVALIVRDITARHRDAEFLTETQRLAQVGGWEYRIDEDRLTWTKETCRIHDLEFGAPITLEQARGYLHPESRDEFEQAWRAGLEKGLPWRSKLRLATPRRGDVWIRLDGRADCIAGRPWRLWGTMQDVSREHAANRILEQREQRLQEQAMLLDEANDAIVLRTLDHVIKYWNRGAERMLGWTRSEAINRNAHQLYAVDLKLDEKATQTVLQDGAWSGDIELASKAGERLLAAARWTLIRYPDGSPKGILEINTNVTEARQVEARLVRAQRRESIGALASGIAHDLNNILAPIILSGDILLSRLSDPDDVELLDSIGSSARRGAEVVRQVLSFARGVESTRVPVNLQQLFRELRRMIRETFPPNITCHIAGAPDLWLIHADPTQVHQVLLNLCVNARDAMPSGGAMSVEAENVTVDKTFAGLSGDCAPGPYVLVRVRDEGPGIPEAVRAQIFDPFFTTKNPTEGTGLGLSTVLAIVRSHRGFIKLDTKVGQGTEFSLYFPAEPQTDARPDSPEPSELPRGHGELILVIDDEKSVCSIVTQGLETAGYRVITAADGAEGLAEFSRRQGEIALVLTDLIMPVMDGTATIRALRRIGPDARIIAMSGISQTKDVQGVPVGSAPNTRFLLKPFTLESLLQAVRDSLDEKHANLIR